MSESITFTVPLVPPSVNHYVKHTRNGRHYVTKEAKAFKEAVVLLAPRHVKPAKRYRVVLSVFLGAGARGDADNFGKCPIDALVSAGVIHSDAAVESVTINKFRDRENPRTVITVEAMENK
jgi:crossover junction endodeoxyribonuclease RusA